MATAIAPRQAPAALHTPARWIDADATIGAALSSDGHTLYTVRRTGAALTCECRGFGFRGSCRHTTMLVALLPVVAPRPARLCEFCGVDVARQASCFCSDRCADRAYTAEAAGELAAMDTEVAPSTDAEIAETARVSQEIRREMAGLPAPDSFLGRLMATPLPLSADARNQAALAAHGMSLAGGTRIERAGDPLENCF